MNLIQRAAVVGNPNENLLNGLVGYWNFDEGAGTIARDSSPVGTNYGTLVGAPSWARGRFGNCILFNGSSQYMTLFQNSPILENSINTFSMWIKPTSYNCPVLVCVNINGTSGGSHNLHLYINSSGILIGGIYNTKTVFVCGKYLIPLNKWTFITRIYNRITTLFSIYVNGIFNDSAIISTPSYAPITLWQIGCGNTNGWPNITNYFYSGLIDNVTCHNRALSDAEVAQLYAYQPNNGA